MAEKGLGLQGTERLPEQSELMIDQFLDLLLLDPSAIPGVADESFPFNTIPLFPGRHTLLVLRPLILSLSCWFLLITLTHKP